MLYLLINIWDVTKGRVNRYKFFIETERRKDKELYTV